MCTQSVGKLKIRVVFDASAVTSDGTSLNNCLYQGPKLQQDIVDILTRFQVHRFAFNTDILCKMYRQVLVAAEYRPFQHILSRSSPQDQLVEYEINTVTYGLNCAQFLALRVLAAIAGEDCAGYKSVRHALLEQTYVVVICVGSDSVDDVLTLQHDMITVLMKSGLELKKWSSNCPAILEAVLASARVMSPLPFDGSDECGIKVLGLQWQPSDDVFGCALSLDSPPIFSKRSMLLECPIERSISLVRAKTKLAPIKSLSIPSLDQNAAALFARWLHRLKRILDYQLNITGIHAWTNSSIVLSWLVNRHESFKVYVSNCVHKINTLLPGCI